MSYIRTDYRPVPVLNMTSSKTKALEGVEGTRWSTVDVDIKNTEIGRLHIFKNANDHPVVVNELFRVLGYPNLSLRRLRAWGHGYVALNACDEIRNLTNDEIEDYRELIEELSVLRFACGMNTSISDFKIMVTDGRGRFVTLYSKPVNNPSIKVKLEGVRWTHGFRKAIFRKIAAKTGHPTYDSFFIQSIYYLATAVDCYGCDYSVYRTFKGFLINHNFDVTRQITTSTSEHPDNPL